jgi:Ca2+-binding RTX toxin-like protein
LASYTLPSDVEVLRFIGAGSFAGSGNDGANTIYGGAGTDTLTGGAGADTLNGGAGSDTASYASATAKVFVDLMTGGTLGDAAGDTFTSIENVTGSNYNDQLFADAVDNVLIGLDGDDVIYGRVGDDTLDGGNGNDLLNGAEGMDQLTGGNGFDTASYFFAATGVTVDLDTGGTAGEALGDIYSSIERVLGSDTAGDELSGTAGTDQLRGLGGNDRLFGKDGYDILSGDAGDDEINGGGGNDDLRGDAGSDTFFFAANFGADVVRDFDADPTDGQDLIDLSSFGVTSATYDAAVLSGLLVISSTGAGGTLITVNDTAGGHTGSINLLNVALTNISASDFIT